MIFHIACVNKSAAKTTQIDQLNSTCMIRTRKVKQGIQQGQGYGRTNIPCNCESSLNVSSLVGLLFGLRRQFCMPLFDALGSTPVRIMLL